MKQKSEIKRTGPELLKRLLRQREMSVFLIILLVVAIVAIVNPKFIQPSNMKSIALSVATDGLLSIGLTLALILGGIELSVGGRGRHDVRHCRPDGFDGGQHLGGLPGCSGCGSHMRTVQRLYGQQGGTPAFHRYLSMMNLSLRYGLPYHHRLPLSVSGYLAGQLPLSGHRPMYLASPCCS